MLNTYLKYSVNNPCLFDAKMFSTQEDRQESNVIVGQPGPESVALN